MKLYSGSNATIFILILFIQGCANPQKSPFVESDVLLTTSDDVGIVSVKTFPAISFSKIREALVPNNRLSPTEARNQATNITMSDDIAYADRKGGSVGIGFQEKISEKEVLQQTDKADQVTNKVTTKSGTAPEPTLPTIPTVSQRTLLSPGIADADLSLYAETGLLQRSAWLNNYLSNITIPKNYEASLITFQVTAQPSRPNLPVNSQIDITLWPTFSEIAKTSEEKLPLVMVHPILMTDNLEANSRSLRANHERNFSFSAGGSIGTADVSMGANSASNSARQRLGQDLNGVTNIGFSENNRISVRLGAQFQAGAAGGIGMVSRSHIVSALVFTHKSISTLEVHSQNHFTDLRTGSVLCDYHDKGGCKKSISELAKQFGVKARPCTALGNRKIKGEFSEDEDVWRDIAGIASEVKLGKLMDCINLTDGVIEREVTRFFASVAYRNQWAKFNSFILSIPQTAQQSLPTKDQTVIIRNEGEAVTAYIQGGSALRREKIFGYWRTGDGKMIASTSVSVDADGTNIRLKFPVHNQLAKITSKEYIIIKRNGSDEVEGKPIALSIANCDSLNSGPGLEAGCRDTASNEQAIRWYEAVYEKETGKEAKKEDEQVSIRVDSSSMSPDKNGHHLIDIRLLKDIGKKISLVTQGADILTVTGAGVPSLLGATFTRAGKLTLRLRNAVEPPDQVQLFTYVDGKPVGTPVNVFALPLPVASK